MKNEIILYRPNELAEHIEVRIDENTVWLTQALMVLLFGRDQSVISKHIRNIFAEGELDKKSVYAKFAYTAADGKNYNTQFYSLDAIISIGYRVNSLKATAFRQWATKTLKELKNFLTTKGTKEHEVLFKIYFLFVKLRDLRGLILGCLI